MGIIVYCFLLVYGLLRFNIGGIMSKCACNDILRQQESFNKSITDLAKKALSASELNADNALIFLLAGEVMRLEDSQNRGLGFDKLIEIEAKQAERLKVLSNKYEVIFKYIETQMNRCKDSFDKVEPLEVLQKIGDLLNHINETTCDYIQEDNKTKQKQFDALQF